MKVNQLLQINEEWKLADKVTELRLTPLLSKINEDCAPFLAIADPEFPLYRGVSKGANKKVKQKHRQNRIARDSSEGLTLLFNSMVEAGTGRRDVRSKTVFCSSDEDLARQYGDLCYVFPAGNIEVMWSSEIEDSTGDYRKFCERATIFLSRELNNRDLLDLTYTTIYDYFVRLSEFMVSSKDVLNQSKEAQELAFKEAKSTRYLDKYLSGVSAEEWHRAVNRALKQTFDHFYDVGGPTSLQTALQHESIEIMLTKSDGYYIVPAIWKDGDAALSYSQILQEIEKS